MVLNAETQRPSAPRRRGRGAAGASAPQRCLAFAVGALAAPAMPMRITDGLNTYIVPPIVQKVKQVVQGAGHRAGCRGLVLAIRAGRRALPSGALLNTSTNSGAGTSSAAWEQPLVHRLGAVVDGRAIASPNSIETVEFNADVVVFCPWLGALRLKGLVLSLKERSERRCRCEAPVCTLLLCAPALDVPFRIPAAVSSGPLGRTALFCAHRSRIQTRHWMAAGQVPLAL